MINLFQRLTFNKLRFYSQFKHEIAFTHKARTKVIEKYEALPAYLNLKPRDPFDYPLRSIQSVREYQKLNPPDFNVEIIMGAVCNEHESFNHQNRIVKFRVKLDDMRLTPKMKERLIFLLDSRYNHLTGIFQIRVDYFLNPTDNMKKGMEIIKELYFEALRAP